MGIQGLAKLLHERAPGCHKEAELKNYFGRVIAVDASMAIYQFLIAMRGFEQGQSVELTDGDGDTTTHLNGLFARTLRMIDEGLKPVYVFDGKAPELKQQELAARRAKAAEAQSKLAEAKEEGDDEAAEKLGKRTVRMDSKTVEECKRLLRLMGVPAVEAASEAEAQCVELVRGGAAWAVGTEDMDALTFGAPVLLRHLTYSSGGGGVKADGEKRSVLEYRADTVIKMLGFTREQFIDLCILLGCDYSPRIPGIGPQKAFEGIRDHKTMEAFLAQLDPAKFPVPEAFNNFPAVREMFMDPPVVPAKECDVQFRDVDADGLRDYLVTEKLFNADRVEKGIQRLRAARQRKTQLRLDQFFTMKPKEAGISAAALATGGAARKRAATGSAAEPALKSRRTTGTKKAVKK